MRKISFSGEKRVLSLSGLSEFFAEAPIDIYIVLAAEAICIFSSQPTCMRQVNTHYFKCPVGRRQVWGADVDALLRRACKRGASNMRPRLTP